MLGPERCTDMTPNPKRIIRLGTQRLTGSELIKGGTEVRHSFARYNDVSTYSGCFEHAVGGPCWWCQQINAPWEAASTFNTYDANCCPYTEVEVTSADGTVQELAVLRKSAGDGTTYLYLENGGYLECRWLGGFTYRNEPNADSVPVTVRVRC